MKTKKGFTLIELMVVMAIIAVLSVLIIAAIQAARRSSVETQNKGNARTIEVALEAVASKNAGSYCATAATGSLPACNTSQKLGTLATWLADTSSPAMLSDKSAFTKGSCGDSTKSGYGGGIINLGTNSFTIYIADNGCSATSGSNIGTLVH